MLWPYFLPLNLKYLSLCLVSHKNYTFHKLKHSKNFPQKRSWIFLKRDLILDAYYDTYGSFWLALLRLNDKVYVRRFTRLKLPYLFLPSVWKVSELVEQYPTSLNIVDNRYALQVNQLLLVKCGTFIPISFVEPLQLTPSQHEYFQGFGSVQNNPDNCSHE